MNRNLDGYISCPYCNKIISNDTVICPHCNRKISSAITEKNNLLISTITDFISTYKLILIILVLFIAYSVTSRGAFQVTHMVAEGIPTKNKLTAPYEAIQHNLSTPKNIIIGKGQRRRLITLQAEYSLTGIVVAKNIHFNLIARRDFDDVVPIDMGIVYGDIANVDYLKKNFYFVSETAAGARWLRTRFKNNMTIDEYDKIHRFVTHNHIIPANDNVASALLKLQKWDLAKLDGYLIDISHPDGSKSYSSLSRTDGYFGSRAAKGGDATGSCEIMYVTGVQIQDQYYK